MLIKPFSRKESYPTPSEIRRKVTERREHSGFQELRRRWESDWDLIQLKEFEVDEGFQSFTSNRPQTITAKITSWLSDARMIVRTSNGPNEQSREAGTALEKFVRGSLRFADERLANTLSPALQDLAAFYISYRGWYAGRALWNNVGEGDDAIAVPEIDVWDPLHIAWDVDLEGLTWLAQEVFRSPEQIERLFRKDIAGTGASQADGEPAHEGLKTFEYMDREIVAVSFGDEWLAPPEEHGVSDPHGRPLVPGFAGYQGPVPILQPEMGDGELWRHVGESTVGQIRHDVETLNSILSIWKTLTKRSEKHPLIVRSPDGRLRLMDDPWKEGANVNLSEGESVEPLVSPHLIANAESFLGFVNAEVQQGSIPDVVFGNIRIQVSGVAANILRAGARHQVIHRLNAMGRMFTQMSNLLRYQYESGEFGTVQFRGNAGQLRKWFEEEIAPDAIADAGFLEIEFKNTLGLDDPQRFVAAQSLRQGPGGVPMAPDEWIWSEQLDVEDAAEWKSQITAQQAARSEPKTAMYQMFEALSETGETTEAGFILQQLRRQLLAEMRKDAADKAQFQLQIRQLLAALGEGDPAAAEAIAREMAERGVGGFENAFAGVLASPEDDPLLSIDGAVMSGASLGLDQFRAPRVRAPGARGSADDDPIPQEAPEFDGGGEA